MATICIHYTQHEADALEVLNTGFFKVFKSLYRYDPGVSSLYTWMRTIIVNSCIDHIRQKQKQVQAIELDHAENVHIEPDIIARFKNEEILDMIRKLPPATQAVFNLYVSEGYNHKEIGKLLNISEGTSKWHLSEARKFLQTLLSSKHVNK